MLKAARLYSQTMRLIALQVGLTLLSVWVRRAWPRVPVQPELLPSLVRLALESAMLVIILIVLTRIHWLAKWLQKDSPALWTLAVMVPCVGLIVLAVLIRAVARELRREGCWVAVFRAGCSGGR